MFSGNNVTDFGPVKMAFDQIICSSCDDDSAKYYYLDQFTSGHARQLVRSCNSGDAAVAFKKAMKLLEDKYGNTYVRSQAYMTRLQQWPKLSLKIGNSPSLNQASYPGVDSLNDLLSLLFKVRSNKFLVVADVRQAFLQIRLSEEEDRNRFSILWQAPDGKLIAYRYKTLVFGLAASPFVSNYVLKFHFVKYRDDLTNMFLNENFYVDNLFITSNSTSEMLNIYHTACERLAEGGFELRSWFSNDSTLQQQF